MAFIIIPATLSVSLLALIAIINPIIDKIKLIGLKITRKIPTKDMIPKTIEAVFLPF